MRRVLRLLLWTLAMLALLLLSAPLVMPLPPAPNTVPPERLADGAGRFVDLAGLRVYTRTAGEGQPALLLLHGFGASLFSWHDVFDPLAERRQVTAFDRPAFGLSERPLPGGWEGDNPYGREYQARLVVKLLDRLGSQRAVLVGHSAGGAVAVLAALRYPERVRALVLVAPALYGGGGGPTWLRQLLATPQGRFWGPLALRPLVPGQGTETIYRAWHDPRKVTPATLAGYQLPLRAENWDRALWEYTLAADSPLTPGELRQVPVPVLVLAGDDDRIVPTTQSARAAADLPRATLVVLPETGHLPHEERPAEFLHAVETFLAALPQ